MRLSWIFTVFLFLAHQCFAYTLLSTKRGSPIRIRYGQKLQLAGNPSNQENQSHEKFRSGIIQGLQQWKAATGGSFDFDYWQGINSNFFPNNGASDGLSSIFFSSHSNTPVDPNVIGYTQTWFNEETGDLVESDIILNDRSFRFSDDPSDTSFKKQGMRPSVFLPTVITHELGHAIGLGHSGDLNSSMLFQEFLEQSRLGCDDVFGARHLYGSPEPSGALSGIILSSSRLPVSGAQVIAFSRKTGLPVARNVTNKEGRFTFGSLGLGPISLAVEPYPGPAHSLSVEYAPKNHNFCQGAPFPLQFITEADGHTLREFQVTHRTLTDFGAHILDCTVNRPSGGTSIEELAPPFFVDSGSVGRSIEYSFLANGPFTITGVTHLLHSPVRLNLSTFDEQGNTIPIKTISPIYSSESGFKIEETQISGEAFGKITLRVVPRFSASTSDPLSSLHPNSSPLFVLHFHSGKTVLNPRCLPDDPFPEYQSPPGTPPRYTSTRSAREDLGFCGIPSAEASENRRTHPKLAESWGRILGWLWPFITIMAFQLNSVRRRAKMKTPCRFDS